jgi:hypothetical protein
MVKSKIDVHWVPKELIKGFWFECEVKHLFRGFVLGKEHETAPSEVGNFDFSKSRDQLLYVSYCLVQSLKVCQ